MKRIFTGTVVTLLVIIAFLLREINLYLFDICIGIITVFASLEVAKLLQKANRKNKIIPSLLFPSFAYILLLLGINWGWGVDKLLIAECLLLIAFFVIIMSVYLCQWNKTTVEKKLDKYEENTYKYVFKIGMDTLFGLIYPTLFLLSFVLINHIDTFNQLTKVIFFEGSLSIVLLLFAVVSTIATDICSLYVGQLFKGKKLIPSISPNKTISGAIGGLLGSVIISLVLFLIINSDPSIANGFKNSNITLLTITIYAILAGMVSQLGDLFESKLKRLARVKDSGNILPGHGGLMDRLDSVCFNVVFTLIFFVAVLI